jgi:hypothetical protein
LRKGLNHNFARNSKIKRASLLINSQLNKNYPKTIAGRRPLEVGLGIPKKT